MDNVGISQFNFDSIAINVVAAWAIQKMKASQWPVFGWISNKTPGTTRLVSVLVAGLSAAGMTMSWTYSASGYAFGISGITAESVVTFAWAVLKSYVFQYGAYKTMFQPPQTAATKPAKDPGW
jgi:hypothetical protein